MKIRSQLMIASVFGVLFSLSGCIVPVGPDRHEHRDEDRRDDHRDDHRDHDDRCPDRDHDGRCHDGYR
jgi:hypothetical protein